MAAGTAPDVIANWWFYQHTSALADLTRDAPRAGYNKADVVYHPQLQEVEGKLLHALHELHRRRLDATTRPSSTRPG